MSFGSLRTSHLGAIFFSMLSVTAMTVAVIIPAACFADNEGGGKVNSHGSDFNSGDPALESLESAAEFEPPVFENVEGIRVYEAPGVRLEISSAPASASTAARAFLDSDNDSITTPNPPWKSITHIITDQNPFLPYFPTSLGTLKLVRFRHVTAPTAAGEAQNHQSFSTLIFARRNHLIRPSVDGNFLTSIENWRDSSSLSVEKWDGLFCNRGPDTAPFSLNWGLIEVRGWITSPFPGFPAAFHFFPNAKFQMQSNFQSIILLPAPGGTCFGTCGSICNEVLNNSWKTKVIYYYE